MRYALAAAIVVTLSGASASKAQQAIDPEAIQAAAAASRFAAIKAACPEAIPTDKVQADKFVNLYGDVGVKIAGAKPFARLVKAQTEQRIREIQVTGPQRWCEDQRRYVRELGETKVFP